MKGQLLTFLIMICGLFAIGQTGSVTGQIIDQEGFVLPGATVTLNEMNKSAISDANGYYRISGLEPGNYEVKVSYIGYNDLSQPLEIVSDETAGLNFVLIPGVEINEVIVVGQNLQNLSRALNQQKNNPNITNVVSQDQIGRFPDANIGDAIKRIPGITMQNDQGEARDIIIRGISKQYNSVTINGERVPSAEGDNRNIQMDLIPADMVTLVEVNKAILPEMDADAIGGSVNLVTRTATSDPRISATFAPGFSPIRDQANWTGALIAGKRFSNDKLGVVFTGSFNRQDYGSDNFEAEYVDDNGTVLLDDFQIRRYDVIRKRVSGGLDLDYRFNNNHVIKFSGLASDRKDWENRFRLRYTDIETDGGVTTAQVRRQTKGGIDNDEVKNRRLEHQKVNNFGLSGNHVFGKLQMDWKANYSDASEERPDERYIEFRQSDVVSSISGLGTEDVFIGSTSPLNSSDFELRELTDENQFTEEENYVGRINFQLPVMSGENSSSLKFGYVYKNKNKVRDNNFFEYDAEDAFPTQASTTTGDRSVEGVSAGDRYVVGELTTETFLGELDLNQFDREAVLDEFVSGNYDSEEAVNGAYIQYNQNIGEKWTFIGGLRYEGTTLDYTGNELDLNDETVSPTFGESDYNNILPGLHVKFNPTNNLAIRGAWTNSIARPNYFDLVPYRLIEDDEIQVGNPDLEAAESMNFDLTGEQYFESIGLVSLGGFYKQIDNFFYGFADSDVNVGGTIFSDFSQPRNGEQADIYGFEFAFQRQLDFLPGVLKNLNLYTNYTFTDSEAELATRDGEQLELSGTAPHVINASLGYEDQKFSSRLSLNHTEDYIDEYGGEAFEDRYYDKQTFLDLNANYLIKGGWRVFFEGKNLTNQPLRFYQGVSDRTMQVEYYQPNYNLGVKFDF